MTDSTDDMKNPGEARTRARRNRKIAYLVFAAIIGAAIGAFLSGVERGEGDFFTGDIENLTLPVWAALSLALAFFFAFAALPLWGFTKIDDYQVRQNLIGYAGGCVAVMAGYPMWAVLAMGSVLPFPTAFGVFALGFLGTLATFGVVKLRG